MPPSFAEPAILPWLEAASPAATDGLLFGVIGMSGDGTVVVYNAWEAGFAGLTPSRVIGRHFFQSVAPCTNNYMIAQRFETESELDALLDYVFTLRMSPTPVRLRLLRSAVATKMYLLVERRLAGG
ncbi:MAG: hypothetical protein WCP77_06835 [Roseococcus sp.]